MLLADLDLLGTLAKKSRSEESLARRLKMRHLQRSIPA